MKKILVILGILWSVVGYSQIQWYQLPTAPDSNYILLSSGELGYLKNFPEYVKASDILGIDTLFQNGDSLCILMRSEDEYRCFPVHQEVRLELVNGGLRVCWEQRDTVWETRNYLHFPAGGPSGITSNRVEARKTSDFEIGSYPSDIEIGIRLLDEKTAYVLGSANYSGASVGYIWGVVGSSLLSSVKGSLGNSAMQPSVASLLFDKEWHKWRIVYEDGERIGYVDGSEYRTCLNDNRT